jgi:hypothetical protein
LVLLIETLPTLQIKIEEGVGIGWEEEDTEEKLVKREGRRMYEL